jgi:hypothetical protein
MIGFKGPVSSVVRKDDIRSVLSDDCDSVIADNCSVTSVTSSAKWDHDCGSDDLNNDNDINEDNGCYIDDFDEKLIEAIDGCNGKSVKSRQLALDAIRKALTTRFCFEFLFDRFVDLILTFNEFIENMF